MPHHPSEEEAPSNLTDKIAQYSSDSTASDHPLHKENKGPIEAVSGSSHGPQIPTGKPPFSVSFNAARVWLDVEILTF